MTLGLIMAGALVGAVLLAVYWGRKAGIDSARAADLDSIREKNVDINDEFAKMRKTQSKELNSIDSSDAAHKLRELGRRRGKDR